MGGELEVSKYLEGKVAIVTGAGQGIGRAIAKTLAAEGAKVVTNNRKPAGAVETGQLTPERLARLSPEDRAWVQKEAEAFNGDAETTAQQIRDAGGEATACFADISDWDEAKKLVDTAVETYGSVDIVVNVAGAFGFCAVEEMPKELWDKVNAVKPTGYFYVIRHAVPYMIRNGWGRIVNCSSGAFLGGEIRQSEYSAANAGVVGLTRALSWELNEHNITVNAFCPVAKTRASIDMELFDRTVTDGKTSTLSGKPLMGYDVTPYPEDFAPFVAYMCTEEAADLTGAVFMLNGKTISLFSKPQIIASMRPENGEDWTVDSILRAAPEALLKDYQNPLTAFKKKLQK